MNDQLLSQNLRDYDQETQDVIAGLIAEEQEKTRAMLRRRPETPAILIGGVGSDDGIFNAVGYDTVG